MGLGDWGVCGGGGGVNGVSLRASRAAEGGAQGPWQHSRFQMFLKRGGEQRNMQQVQGPTAVIKWALGRVLSGGSIRGQEMGVAPGVGGARRVCVLGQANLFRRHV